MCNTCCNMCNPCNCCNPCGGLFSTLFGNSCNRCGCNAVNTANACGNVANTANMGGCGCGCGCNCRRRVSVPITGRIISICPWRLLRRPPKLPLQIRTAVRLIIRPLRGSVSETAVLTHIMPGSTVCILIIRPIAAVAATELFVFNKTANRKIRRIFCY